MDLIGYIGGILLAFCAAPEAYLAWKRGHSSLSWGFLSLWGVGGGIHPSSSTKRRSIGLFTA